MLSITRKTNERIRITLEDGREIMLNFQVYNKRAKVGIEAPKTIMIERLDGCTTTTT